MGEVLQIYASKDGRRIYMRTLKQLSTSIDGGLSWVATHFRQGDEQIELGRFFVRDRFIYVATRQGLIVSRDLGQTWLLKTVKDGLPDNHIHAVFANAFHVFIGTRDSISRTTLNGEITQLGNFGEGILDISGENYGNRIYAKTEQAIFVSHDFGANWTQWIRRNCSVDSWEKVCMGDLGKYYFWPTGGSLHVTTDYGVTWSAYLKLGPVDGIVWSGDMVYAIQPHKIWSFDTSKKDNIWKCCGYQNYPSNNHICFSRWQESLSWYK